jgi:acetoin:2,6-dichlorophenolindophenol oxidoreductase subunit alpha
LGFDLAFLYRQMLRSRRFEEAAKAAWDSGKISGEMHLGLGEEAIVAGVVSHLHNGDAMALDHRSTPPLVMRGVDLTLLFREFLGKPQSLCNGEGGHMHLFSKDHLAASSGIVGASGPLCAGFALAAQYQHTNNVSVAFFGEGAINQGMMMESINLSAAWRLPAVFVCKNNDWSITTPSHTVTGGKIIDRANGFGIPAIELDGTNVEAIWDAAGQAIDRARNGDGPTFLLATCPRIEGHYLGDPLLRAKMTELVKPLLASLSAQSGAPLGERIGSLGVLLSMMARTAVEQHWDKKDPVAKTRKNLVAQKALLDQIEKEVNEEIKKAVEAAMV